MNIALPQATLCPKQVGEQPFDIILLVGSPLTSHDTPSNSHEHPIKALWKSGNPLTLPSLARGTAGLSTMEPWKWSPPIMTNYDEL